VSAIDKTCFQLRSRSSTREARHAHQCPEPDQGIQQSTELLGDAGRCVHIGDRESDIYELFCAAQEAGTYFLIRTCVDRLAGDGDHTIADEMEEVAIKSLHRIHVRDNHGDPDEAVLEIRYRKLRVLPPVGKQTRYPALTLTVIHAQQRGTPKNRKKIDWKLITDLPVCSRADAIEKLEWYALRWKIEVFHKILKSGCKAEESKLRTAQRLANLISVFCILSWRVFLRAANASNAIRHGGPHRLEQNLSATFFFA
jgi:hypothetical protein